MRFAACFAAFVLGCSPVMRSQPIYAMPSLPSGDLPYKPARLLTLEYARCQGYADALLDVASQGERSSRDASTAGVWLGSLTVASAATTGALSARYSADTERFKSQLLNTALIGSIVTAALGIPTAIVSYNAKSNKDGIDAAKRAADKVLAEMAKSQESVAKIQRGTATAIVEKAAVELDRITETLAMDCRTAWQNQPDIQQPVLPPYLLADEKTSLLHEVQAKASDDADLKIRIDGLIPPPGARRGH